MAARALPRRLFSFLLTPLLLLNVKPPSLKLTRCYNSPTGSGDVSESDSSAIGELGYYFFSSKALDFSS